MMSAMSTIQSKADNIMENIMMKELELAEIEQKAKKAEQERLSLEHHSNEMLDEKQKIEENIKFLVAEKNTMEHHIEEQENQVLKWVLVMCESSDGFPLYLQHGNVPWFLLIIAHRW